MTNGRRKGKDAELEVADRLRRLLQTKAERSQQYSGMGSGPGDVIVYDTHDKPMDLVVEVKRRERYSVNQLIAWCQRASSDAGDYNPAIVVHRGSRQPWLVTMQLDDIAAFIDEMGRL